MKRLLLVAALCAAATAFGQGLYWQSKTTGTVGESTSETYIMPRMMKVIHHGGDGSILIIRLDREVFWDLDPAEKTYSEMTFAQMEEMMNRMAGKMDAAMKKMREEMSNMTEEQRKMMMEMMGGQMPGMSPESTAPVKVNKTGEKKTISGYACTKYVVRMGDQTLSTMWVTKDVKGFAAMAEDWKKLSQRMARLAERFGKGLADAYKDIDGFPMQTEMSGIVTTVTKLEQRSTPASEFEIPAGYKKVKSKLEENMQQMEEE
ncbi:MAG TPA: DUF4412 domain-containing protein [Bacteroidota bacterium]|nr:DUF4412 domain-containing protein [Bacteroidota bacterium]